MKETDQLEKYYKVHHAVYARIIPFEKLDPSTKTALRNTLHFQAWNVGQSVKQAAEALSKTFSKHFKPLR